MIRFVAAVLLALSLSGTAEAVYPYDSACRVTVHKNGRRDVGGSGVLIAVRGNQALVLTVKHVALAVGKPVTCNWGGQIMRGRVLAVHSTADVALLTVTAPRGVRPVPVAMPCNSSGPFILAGFPGYDRDTLRYQQGAFAGLDEDTLTVTCRPEKGMSGGPAFDRYGRVVGTVSAYGARYGYCGSGPAMMDLIDNYMR